MFNTITLLERWCYLVGDNLNWFPGHMKQAINRLKLQMKVIDVGIIIVDSRLVQTSLNPEIISIFANKPVIVLLNKTDLADNAVTKEWIDYLSKKGIIAREISAKNKHSLDFLPSLIEQKILFEKINKASAKGLILAPYKLGIIGIPNSGKSTFINTILGSKKTVTKNMPGVTRDLTWWRIGSKLMLLDTPGLLWPKLNTSEGYYLAITGAIPQKLIDPREIAIYFINFLRVYYPNYLKNAYNYFDKLGDELTVLEELAISLGCLAKGGLPDTQLVSQKILKNLENPKYGKISFEKPPQN